MTSKTLTFLLLALPTLAQYPNLPSSGVNAPGIGNTAAALLLSEIAGRDPLSSSSISFTPNYDNNTEPWTWRVNISSLSVPNSAVQLGLPNADYSDNLHVANTQYQLDWPGDEDTLQEFIKQKNMRVEFAIMVGNRDVNFAEKANEVDESGGCASVLGEECMQSVNQGAMGGKTMNFQDLRGCGDVLQVKERSAKQFDIGRFGYSPAGTFAAANAVRRGKTLWFHTSETYMDGNVTEIEHAKSTLQVFVMRYQLNGASSGERSGASILCAMGTEKDEVNVDDSGAQSGAAGRSRSMVVVCAVFVISTIMAM